MGMGKRTIGFLICLLAWLAAASGTAGAGTRGWEWWRSATGRGQHDDSPWVETGKLRKSFALAPGRRLTIESQFGDIEISRGGRGVEVQAKLHARGGDRAEASRRGKNLRVVGEPDGRGGLRIVSGQKEANSDTRVDLTVWVPAGAELVVESAAGTVRVHGLPGPVTIDADVGDITIEGTREPVRVRCRVGNLVLRGIRSKQIESTVDVGETRVEFAGPFSGQLKARTHLGDTRVAVARGSTCRVVTHSGFGQVQDTTSAGVLSRSGPGLIDLDVGMGNVFLTDVR